MGSFLFDLFAIASMPMKSNYDFGNDVSLPLSPADPKWKFVENFVCSTLESSIYGHLYPRTLINIIIQELQCRNNLVAPALNASVCALMNAGISLKYLVAAVCIGVQVDGKSEKLILNPNLDELSECTANLVVVLDNKDYKLISFLHEGSLSIDQFDRAMGLAKGACQDVFKFYKESVKKQFTEVSQVDDQTGDQLDSQPDDQSSDQPDEVVLD